MYPIRIERPGGRGVWWIKSPDNSAIFCKRAQVVATRTVFLVGFVKVDHCVAPNCSAKPRNSVKSVEGEFMLAGRALYDAQMKSNAWRIPHDEIDQRRPLYPLSFYKEEKGTGAENGLMTWH
ncbi:hypothetical protein Y032_0211g2204 [Ancylostoma ceylanicum]|uniref:Uncharacterized protein n=1 Tax=Ancylostoma ceylanicum TaxID=53326 RepID=A0A016SL53_9BILA|nr:hypothetical protein Y032_0211g2204 [Ancylostoma ceylanicum]